MRKNCSTLHLVLFQGGERKSRTTVLTELTSLQIKIQLKGDASEVQQLENPFFFVFNYFSNYMKYVI